MRTLRLFSCTFLFASVLLSASVALGGEECTGPNCAACCSNLYGCYDDLLQSDCLDEGEPGNPNTWSGAGTSCDDPAQQTACPGRGACCVGMVCTNNVTEAACGGAYAGDGSSCDNGDVCSEPSPGMACDCFGGECTIDPDMKEPIYFRKKIDLALYKPIVTNPDPSFICDTTSVAACVQVKSGSQGGCVLGQVCDVMIPGNTNCSCLPGPVKKNDDPNGAFRKQILENDPLVHKAVAIKTVEDARKAIRARWRKLNKMKLNVAISGHGAPGNQEVGNHIIGNGMIDIDKDGNADIIDPLAPGRKNAFIQGNRGKIKDLTLLGCNVALFDKGQNFLEELQSGLGAEFVKGYDDKVELQVDKTQNPPLHRYSTEGEKKKAVPAITTLGIGVMGMLVFAAGGVVVKRARARGRFA